MFDSKRQLKVLFVAAEVAPFSAVGGLSQVMYFLPRALLKLGVDARIFTPRFSLINEEKYGIKPFLAGLHVPTGEKEGTKELICNVKIHQGTSRNPTVYFLENAEYYEQRANVYGYTDEEVRFALLSRGVLEFLKNSDWVPDIIHTNDWHTGYLANFLRVDYEQESVLKKIAAVFSIHNLRFQGNFDFKFASELDLDDGKSRLAGFFSDRFKKQNPVKRGIIYSDIVATVSENYAREIITPDFGEGLDQLLKEVRAKVYGVLNGVDYLDFNPQTDKLIQTNYGLGTLSRRAENKEDLQKEFNLPVAPKIPVLAMEGRLDEQKGLDLVMEVLPILLAEYNVQFIVLGGGEQKYREFFVWLEKEYPQKVATHLLPNFSLPRKIFAGADMLLMPSKWEPGGIVPLEGMRYGLIPVVRSTGGLADSVKDFNPETDEGWGFTFKNFNSMSLFAAIVRALETYKNPTVWNSLVKRAMGRDFSWDTAAKKYLDLYERAMNFRKEQLLPYPTMAFRQIQ